MYLSISSLALNPRSQTGGRLTVTLYEADFVNQVSMLNVNMRPNMTGCNTSMSSAGILAHNVPANSTCNPGHTYRFYTGTPVYAFGYGLSYTNFRSLLV